MTIRIKHIVQCLACITIAISFIYSIYWFASVDLHQYGGMDWQPWLAIDSILLGLVAITMLILHYWDKPVIKL